MAVTPFLMALGRRLNVQLLRREGAAPEAPPEKAALEDHVIVVGYGPAGQRLVRVLRETGIPFIVIELNPHTVRAARAEGIPILYGDASRRHILEHAAIERAKVCVVAINDEAATRRIVELARFLNPTLQIIVRTRFLRDVEPLQQAGADIVVPEELETSVRIFTHVLQAYFVPEDEIQRQVAAIRSGDYRIFRGSIQEAHLMVLQGLDEEGLHTRAVVVREGAPVAGKTLAELNLRQRYGLTVLAVRRG
ncbi:NAD-binding protein, partial [Rhodothermus marinus]|uniref:NAD-binding protein n=1 Tax=Rhodothermus marinus TaxID=29549 RepID=UPI001FB314FB